MSVEVPEELIQQEAVHRKQKTVRRHGACNPCKAAKTKCDGANPCHACRTEKRRSRTCEYSDKAKEIAAAREETKKKERRMAAGDVSPDESEDQMAQTQLMTIVRTSTPNPTALMHRRISLFGLVEEFADVKSSKGRVARNVRRVRERWVELQNFIRRGRFEDDQPTLLDTTTSPPQGVGTGEAQSMVDLWKAQYSNIQCLIDNGDVDRAWNLIPSLIRRIESWEMFARDNTHPPTEEVLNHISSICLSLVDLDSILGFYLGGTSSISAWVEFRFLRPKMEQVRQRDDYLLSKVDLFSTIQRMLRIDTIHEHGIWEFLHFFNGIKSSDPATTLEKLATCITNKAPSEKLGLKMAANLVFATMHCRTASICAHYSQQECIVPTLNSGPSDIIQDMRLHLPRQKGNECSQVVKHAGNVLEAFEVLCDTDLEETARTWFRPYAALIAAVIVGVSGLREKTSDWKSIRARLDRIECCFQRLKDHNPASLILDKAFSLLKEIRPEKGSKINPSKKKTTSGHKRVSSVSSNSSTIDRGSAIEKSALEELSAVKTRKRNIDAVRTKVQSTRSKRRRCSETLPQSSNLAANEYQEERQIENNCAIYASEPAFVEQVSQHDSHLPLNSNVPFITGMDGTFPANESQQNLMQLNDTQYDSCCYDDYSNLDGIRPPMSLVYAKYSVPMPCPAIEETDGSGMSTFTMYQLNSSKCAQDLPFQSNMQNGQPTVSQQTTDSNHLHLNANVGMHDSNLNTQSNGANETTYFNVLPKHFEAKSDQATATSAAVEPFERACQQEPGQDEEQFTPENPQKQWINKHNQDVSAPISGSASFGSINPSLSRRASEPAWMSPGNYNIPVQCYPFSATGNIMNGNFQWPSSSSPMAEVSECGNMFHFDQQHYQTPYQSISSSF